MIRTQGSLEEKFALARALGFEGIELSSPNQHNAEEVLAARDKSGLVIHGIVGSLHWKKRLSDADPTVRAEGLAALETGLRDAQTYGARTLLVVPGKVVDPQNENFEQVWTRSQTELRKLLPLARSFGVKIGIEVVWNNFITTPEQFVRYIDEFNDPVVGGYFDVSNMLKYGVPAATWIRALGKRMLKFDFKGYSHANQWVDIGDGDEDWPSVLAALEEIGYDGWATAETKGGGEPELRDVSERMDRILGLKKVHA